jgi:DNA invertase Pin-like site-specific DNA recombinase
MKLICVSRVSDKEQRAALGGQELKLRHYATPIDPKAEYHRFDESAHHDERKKFAKLVAHIKEKAQKELIGVVFCKVDRYTRGTTNQSEVKTLNDLVRAGKIELHFCDDGLIVTKDSPATDLFRLGINVALAKYYSDTIRENVARRYAQMLHDKTWVGRAPLGYLNVNEGTLKKPLKNIIVDEERSPHIITMFEKRALGMPYEVIANLLTEAGLRSRTDKKLSKSNIEQMINNPFYYA